MNEDPLSRAERACPGIPFSNLFLFFRMIGRFCHFYRCYYYDTTFK